jgi:hypothetical protein
MALALDLECGSSAVRPDALAPKKSPKMSPNPFLSKLMKEFSVEKKQP